MRGGVSSMRVSSMRSAPAARISPGIPRAISRVRLGPFSSAIPAASGFSSFANPIGFGTANGVPGLGFDYAHLAAISAGLRSVRSSNFRRRGGRGQAGFVPIVIGGYPYYDYGDIYGDTSEYDQSQYQPQAQPQPQQPQIIVIQQPEPANQQFAGSGDEAPAASATPAAEPMHDVGEFVLVRRDGRVLFASAFSVVGAQLTYVTPEGIRRSLPMTELDADATQQMNEARGTTVQIHN